MTSEIDKKVIEDLRTLLREANRLLMLARTLTPNTEEHMLRSWVAGTDKLIRVLAGRQDMIPPTITLNINVNHNEGP